MAEQTIRTLSRRAKQFVEEWAADIADARWAERFVRSSPHNLNEYGVDPFGFSPSYAQKFIPLVRFLYRWYFRAVVSGVENLPPRGRVLLIANHSGLLPFDGMVITAACVLEAEPPRMVRSMVERWTAMVPFASYMLPRLGQIVGEPENCRQLLRKDEAVLVFPEGVRGAAKPFSQRYRLQPFGFGFMRLALETQAPIVPVAVVGAEEQTPTLYNVRSLAKIVGAPVFPITPTFPWLFPWGLLPYPVQYHVRFGAPLHFEGDPDDDDAVIGRKVKVVKSTLQHMVNEGLRARKHIFF